jgi:hypothetical protein
MRSRGTAVGFILFPGLSSEKAKEWKRKSLSSSFYGIYPLMAS